MSAKRMPQLVILTFDDSVNDLNKGLYQVSSLNSMSSWLPYSTYLYLDFHLLCSMTKLKEHSREICYSMSWWSRVTVQEDGFLLATGPKVWLKVLLHEAGVCVTAEMITRWGKWVGIYRRGKWLAHFNQQNASHTLTNISFGLPIQSLVCFSRGSKKGNIHTASLLRLMRLMCTDLNFCRH